MILWSPEEQGYRSGRYYLEAEDLNEVFLILQMRIDPGLGFQSHKNPGRDTSLMEGKEHKEVLGSRESSTMRHLKTQVN